MFGATSRLTQITAVLAMGLAFSLATIDTADARRGGGGFGSRGTRTYSAPAPTRTAPAAPAPIDRSMTPRTQTNQANQPTAAQPQVGQQRPGGLFGGFGGSMLGGLVAGGLLGMLLGQGFGGGAGFLAMLVQIALFAGIAFLAMRFFASRRQTPAAAGGPVSRSAYEDRPAGGSSFRIPDIGGGAKQQADRPNSAQPGFGAQAQSQSQAAPQRQPVIGDVKIEQADFEQFERMLADVQAAYGREDYAALRKLTTPEAMSYLSQELGEIATKGQRNRVSDVVLHQGDLSESWSEDGVEYATVAMAYSSIDVMVDRATGDVIEGDASKPTETTEVWTFVREPGEDWKLSAIQSA
ncbi:Tim44 domain-containing protein [Rhizobium sp. CFBP 8762]|uniref:Tim44 domain-containing protein n=1 Tax=Rhizobium sp. CFBP 8762 TaxID=2775279 RepID=UPI001785BC6D|nr:Tim44 domain-containing protein [Rhizobium sp. CFBP 8762]MBD8554339.1 Tim44 domain-containing protein [Rhizobium sp. CFBP 8762]